MKVLVVGAAGKVGSIIRPALEREHDCTYFDLKPVPGAESRTTIGDVNDQSKAADALDGREAVIYLAMGYGQIHQRATVSEINAAFDVNLRGWYRFLYLGLAGGIRRWVYASSLSAYKCYWGGDEKTDERIPTDAWEPYGFSKRLAENVCQAAVQECPQATILALRMIMPQTQEQWEQLRAESRRNGSQSMYQAPQDVQRLFLAALACDTPGCHILQTTGDRTGQHLPNTRAAALLGWMPQESLD